MRVLSGSFCAVMVALALFLPVRGAQASDLLVFAAASLKNALDEVSAGYSSSGGTKVVVSYAASSALAKQIEKAAPADVFISADLQWMDYLAQRSLIRAESRTNLLGNKLVLIAPKNRAEPIALASGVDLLPRIGDRPMAVCDPESVPAGIYAKAAFTHLGIWPALEPRLARADNVRAALQLVARGEANLGVVYATDVLVEPSVSIVAEFPSDSHPPIIYPAGIVASSTNPEAAALVTFLKSPKASAIFRKFGFTILP